MGLLPQIPYVLFQAKSSGTVVQVSSASGPTKEPPQKAGPEATQVKVKKAKEGSRNIKEESDSEEEVSTTMTPAQVSLQPSCTLSGPHWLAPQGAMGKDGSELHLGTAGGSESRILLLLLTSVSPQAKSVMKTPHTKASPRKGMPVTPAAASSQPGQVGTPAPWKTGTAISPASTPSAAVARGTQRPEEDSSSSEESESEEETASVTAGGQVRPSVLD